MTQEHECVESKKRTKTKNWQHSKTKKVFPNDKLQLFLTNGWKDSSEVRNKNADTKRITIDLNCIDKNEIKETSSIYSSLIFCFATFNIRF